MAAPSVQRSIEQPGRRRSLVLLIGDDATDRDLYAKLIDGELSVLAAPTGERGYALACAEEPDLVLIDGRLPDTDGLTICRRLRANPDTASLPVIVFTQPCSVDLLLATVHGALGR